VDCERLTSNILLNGILQSHLQRHTTLIGWTSPESPARHFVENGTGCLVQSEERRFVLTCAHLLDKFESDRTVKGCDKLRLSLKKRDHMLGPVERFHVHCPTLIANGRPDDLGRGLSRDGTFSHSVGHNCKELKRAIGFSFSVTPRITS